MPQQAVDGAAKVHARTLAAAGLPGAEGEGAGEELQQGVAQGQHAVVRVHAADHMDNAGVPGLGLQRPVEQSQQQCSACGQGEQHPLRQCLEALAAIAHPDQPGYLPDGQVEGQHHQSRGDTAHDTQQRIGQRRVVTGKVAPVVLEYILHGVSRFIAKKPILPVISPIITFILGALRSRGRKHVVGRAGTVS